MHSFEPLTFFEILKSDHLDKWHEKEVALRGFLYRDSSGQLILAHEPNLKSCCIGKKEKQVLVFTSQNVQQVPKNAITLQGEFVVNGSNLSLKNAKLLPH